MLNEPGNGLLERLACHHPRFVLYRRKGAKQHEGGRSRRIGGGKHQAHRAAFRPAIDRRALGPNRVHNRAYVANPLFKSLFGDPV